MKYLFFSLFTVILMLSSACSKQQETDRQAAEAIDPALKQVTEPAQTASEFRQFLNASYAQDMAQKPRTATLRGIRDNNREWNPYSEAFYEKQRAQWEERLLKLRTFDPSRLSEAEALSWRLYEQELLRNIANDNFRHHQYIIHQYRGAHTRVPTFLANMQPVDTVQDAEDYIARLNAVDTLFGQVIEQLQIRTEKGLFLPDWSYSQMLETAPTRS